MKHLVFLFIFSSVLAMSQSNKGAVEDCAPMKKGKVCYTDAVEMKGVDKSTLFNAIDMWAKKNYGKDVFMSNVSSNKNKGTILVSSKVELLLNDSTKTLLRYKMYINCENNNYSCDVTDIHYQYTAKNNRRFKHYAAEEVIADNGKSNTAEAIKDPLLFCKGTFFFAESLFAEVNEAVKIITENPMTE